ncbi:MAG: GNAT family N-acetyltransferase [Gammaproteobacteria bacterium]|nr:GNAT family N-acetyltransferase [Gammaproteobacteria bacterium]
MTKIKNAPYKAEMKLFLSTDRLFIMEPSFAAFDSIHKISRKNLVMKFIGDGSLNTKAKTRLKIKEAKDHFDKFGYSFGPVYEKKTMRFVGQAGIFHLHHDDNQPNNEIGYRLHPSAFGKGYATELAKGLIAWAFNGDQFFDAVYAIAEPDNVASQQVLLRAGLTLQSEDEKLKFYKIDRQAYAAKSSAPEISRSRLAFYKPAPVEGLDVSDMEMAKSSFGRRRR